MQTLETLEGSHELVNQLLNFRRVDQLCKNFVREDENGGIQGNLWPDGRLHPGFSPMTDTGRLRSRNPNVQNWPKASEGKLVTMFKGEKPPSLRPMICAPDGWWVVECDYKQAELFVLCGLSDDPELHHALTIPGNDMHDITAIASFYLEVLYEDMTPAPNQELLDLAAKDILAFEKLQKTLLYRDPKGKVMDRKDFKSTIRVSAKAVNFGIPYGRGAAAIAMQVNAETGLGVTTEEIQQGIDGWKRKFRVAWATMERCMRCVISQGYVENPWGRRRYFTKSENKAALAANEREAANFPIQSTVADTMAIAVDRIVKERNRHNMRFQLMNQVHDAFIALIPDDELTVANKIIEDGMSGVDIPMPHGKPLRLATDLDVSKRWCETT
jgi:DNA polymerase I-like protein with 3'-5' exonuclease and polymerase domains